MRNVVHTLFPRPHSDELQSCKMWLTGICKRGQVPATLPANCPARGHAIPLFWQTYITSSSSTACQQAVPQAIVPNKRRTSSVSYHQRIANKCELPPIRLVCQRTAPNNITPLHSRQQNELKLHKSSQRNCIGCYRTER